MNKCFVTIAAGLLFPFVWATAQISGFKAASTQTQQQLEKKFDQQLSAERIEANKKE
jgi:hypothetical protein